MIFQASDLVNLIMNTVFSPYHKPPTSHSHADHTCNCFFSTLVVIFDVL